MFRTVVKACKSENLIVADDLVLVGLSGGADSVCLLLLLIELQKEIAFTLQAVHIEHGIRGEESEADASFVEALCRKLCVPLQVFHVKAIEYAREKRLGLEEAARILRYDCYRQAAMEAIREKDAGSPCEAGGMCEGKPILVKLALAHHADDNAETVLFQMIRGSRLDGLAGMQPKRKLDGQIEVIRPLLSVTRSQIEAYLEGAGQAYCIDSTNAETIYSRNKMRREVLPLLTEINAQAVSHINQSAAYLRELSVYLEGQVVSAVEQVLCENGQGILIKKEALFRYPYIIQSEVLHLALVKAAGMAKDISANHVQSVSGLFELQVGRCLFLPYGMVAKRSYEGVVLYKDVSKEAERVFFSIKKEELEEFLLQGDFTVTMQDAEIRFQLLDKMEETTPISKNSYTKCFDYDKIEDSFQIRNRMEGDYLIIDDAMHKKRLKEYFINEKIPAEQRGEILLLAEGAKILWVIGGRISADVKISNQTTKILKVQITGGNYHES